MFCCLFCFWLLLFLEQLDVVSYLAGFGSNLSWNRGLATQTLGVSGSLDERQLFEARCSKRVLTQCQVVVLDP